MTDDPPFHVLHRTGEDAVVVVHDDMTVAAIYGYRNDGLPLVEVELHVQRRCDLGDVFLVDDCDCRARLDHALLRLDRPGRTAPGVLVYVERDEAGVYDAVASTLRDLGVERVRPLSYSVAEALALRDRGLTVLHGLNPPVEPASTSDEPPIVAYLPRDWPRHVGDVVSAQPRGAAGVAEAMRLLVDDWVHAAATS